MRRPSNPATAPIPAGSALRQFAMTTLILEAMVIGFFGLAAFGLRSAATGVIWTLTGVGILAAIASTVLVVKIPKAGVIAGSITQGFLLTMAAWIPLSLLVSVPMLGLWILSVYFGAKVDRERAVRRVEQARWEAKNPAEEAEEG